MNQQATEMQEQSTFNAQAMELSMEGTVKILSVVAGIAAILVLFNEFF